MRRFPSAPGSVRRDDAGTAPMEYVLLAAGVSVAIAFGAGMIGNALNGVLGKIADRLVVPALVDAGTSAQSRASTECERDIRACR